MKLRGYNHVTSMSQSAGLWVHCGVCKNLYSQVKPASLNITSCGKVICSSCLPLRPQTNDCAVCQGSCSMIPLNSKAPAHVLNMFKDASTQLKTLNKSLRWQEDQKQRIKKHQESEVRRLEAEVEQQQEEVAKVEREVEERRAQLRMQEKFESQLKYRLSSLNLGRLNKDLERSGKCEKETQRSQGQPQRAPQAFAAPPRHSEAVEKTPRALPLSSAFYRGMATFGPSANNQHLAAQQACCYDNKSMGASISRSDQHIRKQRLNCPPASNNKTPLSKM